MKSDNLTRTQKNLVSLQLDKRIKKMPNLCFTDPLCYLDFLKLVSSAKVVLTDSGGIQEETTILQIPCLTLRENTKRPVTVEVGSNRIVGLDTDRIVEAYRQAVDGEWPEPQIPLLWDGHATERIVKIALEKL